MAKSYGVNWNRLLIPFGIGILLLISGYFLFQFGGHKLSPYGFIMLVGGFVLAGGFGKTILEVYPIWKKNKRLEAEYQQKIKLLMEFVSNAPENSKLVANGLYGNSMQLEVFKSLYPDQNSESRNNLNYIVELTEENKKKFEDAMIQDPDGIMSDFVHVEILFGEEILLKAFDHLDAVTYNQTYYPSIDPNSEKNAPLELEATEKVK